MKRSSKLSAVAVVFGLLAGGAWSGEAWADSRHITVTGEGKVHMAPDNAQVDIGVRTRAARAQDAWPQNNTQMNALLQQIQQLGVEPRDIQTSGLSITAQYDKDGHTVTGYEVDNTVSVTIREIGKAGTLLDQVVSAGANQINSISFSVSDQAAAQKEARDKAMANALTKAEQLAADSHTHIKGLFSISETGSSFPAEQKLILAGGAEAPAPIQPGELTVSSSLEVTYEIE